MLPDRVSRTLGDDLNLFQSRLDRLERKGRGFALKAGVRTYAQPTAPVGNVSPGSLWVDTDDKNRIYRFIVGSGWVPVLDPSVDADRDKVSVIIASHQDAEARADNLVILYRQVPPPSTHAVGDLWVNSDTAELYRWSGTAWVDQGDTLLGLALALPANLLSVGDGIIRTWWQFAQPTASGFGDLWVDTSKPATPLYRWDNHDWIQVIDWSLSNAAALIQTKVSTFRQPTPPTSTATGDLWLDTDDGNRQYRAFAAGVSAVGPTGWVDVQDSAILSAQQAADQAIVDAADAQASADGKVTTYFQTAAPTGLALTDVGDLWFDTDDGNKMYRWSGTAWIVSQDTTISAAYTAATNAQTTADAKITTFYTGTTPTAITVGDLWVNTATQNKMFRWSGTSWVTIRDQTITTAQATADSKVKTFIQGPTPTSITAGDLWIDNTNGNKMYRASAIGVSVIGSAGWVLVQDSAIATASLAAADALTAAQSALTAAQAAQSTADGSIRTFYQANAPLAGDSSIGDLWFDTDDNQAYRWDGSTWMVIEDNSIAVALAAAQNAQTTADGKIDSFYQAAPPTVASLGDLWFDTDDGNKTYYCTTASTTGSPAASWTSVRDTTIATAQATANLKITTFRQGTTPTSISIGDIWFNTLDGNKSYTAAVVGAITIAAGQWVLSQDTGIPTAQATANSKTTTFYTSNIPTSVSIGDIWYDTAHDNTQYRAAVVGTNVIGLGDWVPVKVGILALQDTVTARALGSTITSRVGTPPPNPYVGDIWINIANNQRSFYWTGTSWAPNTTDGFAPSISPPALVNGGIASLFISWEEVPNQSEVTYEVHVVADPPAGVNFTPTSSTLQTTTTGTIFAIHGSLVIGGALNLDGSVLYCARIVARDGDGSAPPGVGGSGTVKRVQTANIAPNAITGSQISDFAVAAKKMQTLTHMIY